MKEELESSTIDNREKIISETIKFGNYSALSNSELLAMFIESKKDGAKPFDIAKKIIAVCNGDLSNLTGASFNEICRKSGLTGKNVIRLTALLELSSRIKKSSNSKNQFVTSSEDCIKIVDPIFEGLQEEQFWVIYLNNSLRVLECYKVGEGALTSTAVNIRMIVKRAINNMATKIILSHNHPNSSPKPSPEDIEITAKIKQATALFDIGVLDHIIYSSKNDYYSFNDNI